MTSIASFSANLQDIQTKGFQYMALYTEFINMVAARIEPGASFQQHGIEAFWDVLNIFLLSCPNTPRSHARLLVRRRIPAESLQAEKQDSGHKTNIIYPSPCVVVYEKLLSCMTREKL